MKRVDRRCFAGKSDKPYADEALPIGHNATLSAPHMHGVGLDIIESVIPTQNARVLDVGAGSGCVFSLLAQASCPLGIADRPIP